MVRIRIFPAKKKHIAELDVINRECLPENYPEEYWTEVISHHLSWIAQINNKIVGYIIIDKSIDDDGHILSNKYIVVSIAVSEEYRRLGCANKLMQEAISELKKTKAKSSTLNTLPTRITMSLHVRVGNQTAQKLYSKFGFTKNNEITNYYIDPIENAFEMVKTF